MRSAVGIFVPGSDRRLVDLRWVSESTKSGELAKTLVEQWIWSFDSDAEKIGEFLLSTKTVWTALLQRDFTLKPDYMEEVDGDFPAWMDNMSMPPKQPLFKGMICYNSLGDTLDISWYHIFDTETNELHSYKTAGIGGLHFPSRVIRMTKRFDNYYGTKDRLDLYATFESLLSDSIRSILVADEWLEPLNNYKDCVADEIPMYLDEHACDIESHYERMTKYWGSGTQFYGHTQDYVVETLHKELLLDWGLDINNEGEDESEPIHYGLSNKEYFARIRTLRVALDMIMDRGKMLIPIIDYRPWAVDFELDDKEVALLSGIIQDIQKTAWGDNVYKGRHDWFILRDIHIEFLVQKAKKGK